MTANDESGPDQEAAPATQKTEPWKNIPQDSPIRQRFDLAADQFVTAPTHGTAADVLAVVFDDTVIFEKYGPDFRGDFFYRSRGTCYFESYPEIRRVARKILEAAAARVLALNEQKTQGKSISELYESIGKAKSKARTKEFLTSALGLFSDIVFVANPAWNTTAEVLPTLTDVLDFSGPVPIARPPKVGEYFKFPVPCTAAEILADDECPAFDAFIESLFPDIETRKSGLDCIAAAISGKPSKCFQIWTNPGSGGKNTVFDLIRNLVPGRVSMVKNSLIQYKGDPSERRFGEIEMLGKTGVFFDEVAGAFDLSAIKRYTGLSAIRGEAKGRDSVEFQQTWALIALCNELPKFFPASDQAFLSRLFILPFESVFYSDDSDYARLIAQGTSPERLKPAKDKDELLSQILAEQPAILKKLANVWIEMRGHGCRPFESADCRRKKERYRSANDDAERFFDEFLTRPSDDDTETDKSASYEEIKAAWSEFSGSKTVVMRDLIAILVKRFPFIEPFRSHGKRKLRGVRLKKELDPDSVLGASGASESVFLPRGWKIKNSNYGMENANIRHPRHPDEYEEQDSDTLFSDGITERAPPPPDEIDNDDIF